MSDDFRLDDEILRLIGRSHSITKEDVKNAKQMKNIKQLADELNEMQHSRGILLPKIRQLTQEIATIRHEVIKAEKLKEEYPDIFALYNLPSEQKPIALEELTKSIPWKTISEVQEQYYKLVEDDEVAHNQQIQPLEKQLQELEEQIVLLVSEQKIILIKLNSELDALGA